MDEAQPFAVPFRPYAWSSYPRPGLGPLVQQGLHAGLEVDRGPAALAFFGEQRAAHPGLYSERVLGEEAYGDYRRHAAAAAALLFPDRGLRGKAHGAKAPSDLLCPSLVLNGAYKCVKCAKVRTEGLRGAASNPCRESHEPVTSPMKCARRCSPLRTVWRCTSAGRTAAPGRSRANCAAKPSATQ